ncbi:MAG: UDP-N-acetylmuramoyl-L-alanine--D-glutamate ligase [Aquificota bacterium]|nr:UDP-N-acetylmuramoyl-L-alanine--D-glutamate ligase [Aquificota bacterium]
MKRYLVWGLGKSGRSATGLLRSKGFEVFCGDDARGDRWEEFIDLVDAVVLSPGVPPSHPLWREALKRDIEVLGELELAWRFFRGRVIAVTGTDGKSTTVRLISLMTAYPEGGNAGTPLSDLVLKDYKGPAVIEVSSFQGKTLSTFRPSVGVFLNFSPDHLDWHPDLEDYLRSKYRIFLKQEETDLILVGPQEEVRKVSTRAERVRIPEDVRVEGGSVLFRGVELFRLEDIKLRGYHNLMNAVFASVVAHLEGVPTGRIRSVLSEFRGLPFRLELVGSFRGVEVYNDSKSTTPNSLKVALESFPDGSVVLIAGGKDKGASFEPLRDLVSRKAKAVVLIGEAKNRIREEWRGCTDIFLEDSLEDAVRRSLSLVRPGDFLLFSPGCSSFDMFSNYVERGEAFNRLVKDLVNYLT